jgi:fatty acid amide hydrolase
MALWRLPATTLSAMLSRGEVRAREVLDAHLARIDEVEPRVHAFTEILRDEAAADADASDARRSRGEARGALDGLPVTVKECYEMAGRATTLGLPSWRGRLAERDAALVTALREAGAVVVGRTNLSQTMLYVEARNPVFGQTNNPWSLAHTPGGSSGGEAAAIASGMSPLGVGTDIGGSIRAPAHFCGVAGIKPTLDRLPMRGYRNVLAGQEAVRGMGGPIARTVGDLGLFFRSLDPARLATLDPRVPPLPWSDPERVPLGGLRVGTYADDGVLAPSRALERAVSRAAEALRARGCTVRPFEPPEMRSLLSAYLGALSADGGTGVVAALMGGEVDPVLEPLRRMARVPPRARRAMSGAARIFRQDSLALVLEAMGEKSVSELWALTDRLRGRRAALLEAMDRASVDLLICPPFATPALPHGESKNFTLAASYSIVFNVAQLPAGVVPVSRVRVEEARREAGRDLLQRRAAKIDAASADLPVGVQVVGRPWRDHEVLAAMAAIEAEVSREDRYPATPVDPSYP